MAKTQRNCTSVRTLLLVVLAAWSVCASAAEPLSHDPVVWYANDNQPSEMPEFHEPRAMNYAMSSFVARPFSRFWHPGRFFRRVGTGDTSRFASDVNALDEVVNSTWFTNRIGVRELSAEELTYGPGLVKEYRDGPDRSSPWIIIGAKTAGVTPGFRIKDGNGDTWLLKFDPPSHPGMTIRAGVVANLIFHAIGFNTPVDRVVIFDRQDLIVGEGARMKVGRDGVVAMTEANLDSILTATGSIFDGEYHALASRYLDGIPVGPFGDQDTRHDDSNDHIKHENRRELRGLKVFAAWLNHFDTKMQNSLDMYVGEPGEGYVEHYLIDFASTLGAYGDQAVKRFGYEFGLDLWPSVGRTVTLGFVEDTWVQLERPAGLSEVGIFDVATFEPNRWKPDLPHSAMASMNDLDGYWAAKIVASFSESDLRVLLAQGKYRDSEAMEFLLQGLLGRRDKIASYWFNQVPPLDHFVVRGDRIVFSDLAVMHGYAEPSETTYRYRAALANQDRHTEDRSSWQTINAPSFSYENRSGDRPNYEFVMVEVQVKRDGGWSQPTKAYFSRRDGHTVAVER
jgi:hypothetical protein